MKFEVGHFYAHEAGRHFAVLGVVGSFKWGPMLVIEEADHTGHAISCSEIGQEANENNWIEIGKDEFLSEFPDQWRQRVIAEKYELDQKIAALKKVCEGGAARSGATMAAMKETDRELLQRQFDAMENYSNILGERIAEFGGKP